MISNIKPEMVQVLSAALEIPSSSILTGQPNLNPLVLGAWNAMLGFMNNVWTAREVPEDVHFFLYYDKDVQAFALRIKETYYVGISSAMLSNIPWLVSKLLRTQPLSTFLALDLPNPLGQVENCPSDPFEAYRFLAETQPSQEDMSKEQIAAAINISLNCLAWVALHELGHIGYGHLDYQSGGTGTFKIIDRQQQTLISDDTIRSHGLEMMADGFALNMMLTSATNGVGDELTRLKELCTAQYIILRALDDVVLTPQNIFETDHPPAALRTQFSTFRGYLHVMKGMGTITPKEWAKLNLEAMAAVEEAVAYLTRREPFGHNMGSAFQILQSQVYDDVISKDMLSLKQDLEPFFKGNLRMNW